MNNGQYRNRWMRRTGRERGTLCQAAVARVLTDHLERNTHVGQVTDARALKDLVSRAFSGEHLTESTLQLFISAFGISDSDRDRIRSALTSKSAAISRTGKRARARTEMIFPQRHRTVNLVERYVVEGGRYLRSRHTTQTIRAVEDGVWFYFFNHEPEAHRVDVLYGGRPGRKHRYGSGLHGIEIELERPLRLGETAALDYHTRFGRYQALRTEVRRQVHARVENAYVIAAFAGKLPRQVWWCVWDDHLSGEPSERHPLKVADGTARLFVPALDAAVGFQWTL